MKTIEEQIEEAREEHRLDTFAKNYKPKVSA